MLVLSTDTPRAQWPLGRITKTFIGSDGRICVVNVQVGLKGVYMFSTQVGSTSWSHKGSNVKEKI